MIEIGDSDTTPLVAHGGKCARLCGMTSDNTSAKDPPFKIRERLKWDLVDLLHGGSSLHYLLHSRPRPIPTHCQTYHTSRSHSWDVDKRNDFEPTVAPSLPVFHRSSRSCLVPASVHCLINAMLSCYRNNINTHFGTFTFICSDAQCSILPTPLWATSNLYIPDSTATECLLDGNMVHNRD